MPRRLSDSQRTVPRRNWTRDELLVLLNAYEKIPFGQFDQDQQVIKDIAGRMARSPGSVAMKLCNLASLDPAVKARGRKGLPGASELDRRVWKEFQEQRDSLAPKTEEAFRNLFGAAEGDDLELIKGVGVRTRKAVWQPAAPTGPTAILAQVTLRRGQQFFRQVILNTFNNECCVTGIGIRDLLVASHILPWSGFPNERLDPRNGLCLSRLHDGAFDAGLITFDQEYRLVLSKALREHLSCAALQDNFQRFEGKSVRLPQTAVAPRQDFLQYHRDKIFSQ